MKKFTRFFATVAAVSMVAASLAGCGSKSDNTASTDTTADSATAGDTLKIGGIGPITGGAAVYGLAVKNAAELAVKEINEQAVSTACRLNLNLKMMSMMQKNL